MPLFHDQVTNLDQGKEKIRSRRFGVIEVVDETFRRIRFRPWPKMISSVEANWLGGWRHQNRKLNRCLLYYNQPLGSAGSLALKYVQSSLGTSYATFRGALVLLDEVAKIKNSCAIVAEVTNSKISERFILRQGWEPHLEHSRYRHIIRRFYGEYPDHSSERILEGVVTPMPSIDELAALDLDP